MIPQNTLFLPPPSRKLMREVRRVRRHNKRAREQGTPATLTIHQWLQALHRHNWRCAFCGGKFECIEHKVRLADGGGTTARNCVPCCEACNYIRKRFQEDVVLLADFADVGVGGVVADLVQQMIDMCPCAVV